MTTPHYYLAGDGVTQADVADALIDTHWPEAIHQDLCHALKYIWRCGGKGPAEGDLAKARYWIERALEKYE